MRAGRLLFWENARDILLLVGTDGRILDANPTAIAAYGYGLDELLAFRIHDLRDPETVPEVDAQMERAGREGILFETVHRRKDGTRFPVEVSSRGIVIGRKKALLSIIRDISRRKEAEGRVAEALEFNRKIIEASPLGILTYNASGQCVSTNDATGRIIGATRAQILAQNFREIEPFRKTGVAALADEALATGTERRIEFHTVSTFGTEVWLDCTIVPFSTQGDPHLLFLCVDMTKRREAEKALRASTEFMTALVRNAPLAIAVFDEAGIIQLWNPAAERMFGWSAEEVLGRFHPIVPGDKIEEFRALREVALRGESFTGVELRRRRKDGVLIDISVSTSPLYGLGGGITGIMSIIADISERRRAEEAATLHARHLEILSTASQKINTVLEVPVILRTLVSSAIELVEGQAGAAGLLRDGTMVFKEYDRGGSIVPIDFSFGPGHGVPGHVLETKEPYISNDTASDPRVIQEIRKELGFYNLIDVPILDRRGELLGCFEIHNTVGRRPFDEQDVIMLQGLAAGAAVALENARMLEEREKAERELRLLATAIDQSAETILITDRAGNIRYVNPAFEKITGYRREEVLGQTPRFLKSGRQDPAFYRQMWETILRGEVWTGFFVNRKKDGSLYDEEAILSPVRDASGEVVHIVAVKRDVTGERRMEEELRHAQKMEAVGRLAGGVAHDFNNLLTAVTGYSEMLLSRLDAGDPSRREIAEIRKAGERAASLTRQLLAFSRKQVLQPKVIDLNATVADMKKMLLRLIGEDVELMTSFGEGEAFVRADPGQIEQVLVNLAVNSRDAMPGGGKLILETACVDLDEEYVSRHDPMPPGSYVMLAVTDTGSGMDEETMSRIFEPFFTTKETGKGTGLGLSTVYGIVKQSGGYIWAYSEAGKGTTFRIYLPRVERPAEPAEKLEPPPPLVEGVETVLVTEDEEMVRDLVCAILRRAGFNVLETRDGEEALEKAMGYEGPIHLVITDVVMPKIGGPELAKRLMNLRPEIRVLFISGYTDTAVTQLGMLPPGSAFLAKPFVPSVLISRVRDLLDAT